MKLLLLVLMGLSVQDRERDAERKSEGRAYERDVKQDRPAAKRETPAMRRQKMMMKRQRDEKLANDLAAYGRKLEGRLTEFAESIRSGDDETVAAFKKALRTSSGLLVMKDRAQEAYDRLKAEAEREIVRKHLSRGEYALQEEISERLAYFRAYQKHLSAVQTLLREVVSKIPDERGPARKMRALLSHETSAHTLYDEVFMRFHNRHKKKRGRLLEEEAAALSPDEVTTSVLRFMESYVVQPSGDRYLVNKGEGAYLLFNTIPEYARKKVLHEGIDAESARLSNADVKAFYGSYLGKDHLEEMNRLEFQAVRSRVYDGFADWVERHFHATEDGRVMKPEARDEVEKVLAQIRRVQEGVKNDGF